MQVGKNQGKKGTKAFKKRVPREGKYYIRKGRGNNGKNLDFQRGENYRLIDGLTNVRKITGAYASSDQD